ncbi:hypothetical protein [Reyranella soli]|jgi:uncharacterized coiled-coil DUF342 family protein|uniref:Uncharacterized protein n=1 Tax=Reyranella soli TaxID=1230389 RepID=A0A512NTL4_9HYPH|nr:hypothetical protein [Reyranella soli]GEP62202.1 hypothetical protein RSO01_93680 [Reyranella soli]
MPSDLSAQRVELDCRRAELHCRSKALKAPRRDATEAQERAFVAELDRLEVASDELEQEISDLKTRAGQPLA